MSRIAAARKRLRVLRRKRSKAKRKDRRRTLTRAIAQAVRYLRYLRRGPDFNGHPKNVSESVKRVIEQANSYGLYVTSTTDGGHTKGSYHYPRDGNPGRAVDVAGPYSSMVRFQNSQAKTPSRFDEIFGPNNDACVKNGRRLSLAEGSALENQHDNHVHLAPR